MSLVTTTAKSLACSGCGQWAVRTFIASIGGPSTHYTPPRRSTPSTRKLTSQTRRWNEAQARVRNGEREGSSAVTREDVLEEATKLQENATASVAEEAAPSQSGPFLPWYLQVEPAIEPQENVLSARQKIPDLPEHPPPVLEPLLQHISVELGMDDLSLLDLRGIDPPPALGANLLMIVGTARSEKHLHYSADKLCRWLRSEHNLTPHADGLLGRQELKLKMRRRAKRSKLMSAVGAKATADSELDEGIRTGWICVNMGRVEGGELPKSAEESERAQNVVGFGTGFTGSNVVVQLLTEDKRGEIELERLWMAVLKKTEREREALLVEEETANTAPVEHHLSSSSEDSSQSTETTYHPIDGRSNAQESTV